MESRVSVVTRKPVNDALSGSGAPPIVAAAPVMVTLPSVVRFATATDDPVMKPVLPTKSSDGVLPLTAAALKLFDAVKPNW